MRAVATFDIGTTAVKAVLVDEASCVLWEASQEIPTRYHGDFREQEPEVWWQAFCQLMRGMAEAKADIAAICMSGQMQDVICLDEHLRPLRPAILYSDGRAQAEARELTKAIGAERLLTVTGNPFDGSIPLPKLLWLKRHEPEVFARTRAFLISSKDYVITRLTGQCAGDRTACSTAGCMDLATGEWDAEFLQAVGVGVEKMPKLFSAHEIAGRVTSAAAMEAGCPADIPVYAGAGDAGATSLASGLTRPGQYNINLGTSGWVATVSRDALRRGGVFNLAAMPEELVINVVPFLNGASVHKFLAFLLSNDGSADYAHIEALLRDAAPGANGVTALPYLVGERFPVLDEAARGAFVGMTPNTTQADLAQAMLEAVAFSLRQGIKQMATPVEALTLIGGGARVQAWRQILADVLGTPIAVFKGADTLPARAIAAAAWIGEGVLGDYDSFIQLLRQDGAELVEPRREYASLYDDRFDRFQHLYRALQEAAL